MSTLMSMYNEMSAEDKDKLGKVGSGIRTAGTHLVSIVEAVEINNSRLQITFKTAGGETAKWVGFLTTKDKETNEELPNTRTMNTLTFICNAVGLKMQAVLGKGVSKQLPYGKGKTEVPCTEFTALTGKKLYIVTTTSIEGDDKNPEKVYVKQEVDGYKFFDTAKRNSIEIAANKDEGTTMEAADEEAKQVVNIHYKWRANEACIRKEQELLEKLAGNTSSNNVGTTVTTPVSDDDI